MDALRRAVGKDNLSLLTKKEDQTLVSILKACAV
jgi:hypothetical protein